MSDRPLHRQNREKKDLEKLLKELEAEETDFEYLAGDTGEAGMDDKITVSEKETEQVLASVRNKLGFDIPPDKTGTAPSHAGSFYRYLLAAAVILLVFGAGWLLYPKTTYVPRGETKALDLPDGSRVELNSGTELRMNRLYGITNRRIAINGEAFFSVVPSELSFVVKANGSVTEVTGTEFNVRSWSDDPGSATTIAVVSGEVNFYPENNTDERVVLSEGLSSRWLRGSTRPSDPDSVRLENVLAWTNRNLSFMGESLQVIFSELERKFDTNIEIADDEIRRETLTTFYTRPENLDVLLDDITTVMGLNYRETANGYVVFIDHQNR